MSRHLRRVHKNDVALGLLLSIRIRVNNMARELGIQSKTIIAFLAEPGQPNMSHSDAVDAALADKVREHFGPGVDRRGDWHSSKLTK